MSAATKTASAPALRNLASTSRPASSPRAVRTRRAPSAPRRSAVARPIPRVAPVTIRTLPSSRFVSIGGRLPLAAVDRAVNAGAVLERRVDHPGLRRLAALADPFGNGFDPIDGSGASLAEYPRARLVGYGVGQPVLRSIA